MGEKNSYRVTPGSVGATKSLLLVCAPRSGSTYLCDLLSSSGRCGFPGEWIHDYNLPVFMEKAGVTDLSQELDKFLLYVFQHGTREGVFSIKIMYAAILHLLKLANLWQDLSNQNRLERFLKTYFKDSTVLFLERRDKTAQAISYYKATQSGRWHSDNKAKKKESDLFCDPHILNHIILYLKYEERMLKQAIQKLGFRQQTFYYEDALENRENFSHGVSKLMRYRKPLQLVPPKGRKILRTPINKKWKKYYTDIASKGLFEDSAGKKPKPKLPGSALWIEIKKIKSENYRCLATLFVMNTGSKPLILRKDPKANAARIFLMFFPKNNLLIHQAVAHAELPDRLAPGERLNLEVSCAKRSLKGKGQFFFVPYVFDHAWMRLCGSATPVFSPAKFLK
jgi:LPS sulfotransferase NodH